MNFLREVSTRDSKSVNSVDHRFKSVILHCLLNEPRHDKTNNMSVRSAKTQISLGIRPV